MFQFKILFYFSKKILPSSYWLTHMKLSFFVSFFWESWTRRAEWRAVKTTGYFLYPLLSHHHSKDHRPRNYLLFFLKTPLDYTDHYYVLVEPVFRRQDSQRRAASSQAPGQVSLHCTCYSVLKVARWSFLSVRCTAHHSWPMRTPWSILNVEIKYLINNSILKNLKKFLRFNLREFYFYKYQIIIRLIIDEN